MKSAYRILPPSALLKPFVRRYWEFDSVREPAQPGGTRKVIPEAVLGLVINIENSSWIDLDGNWQKTPSALLQGTITRPYILQSPDKTHSFGIHFTPEGLLALFGLPQSALVNQFGELQALLGTGIQDFIDAIQHAGSFEARVQLSETYLLRQLNRARPPLPYLGEALQLIRQTEGAVGVQDLSDRLYISRRQLERQFSLYFGLSPKTFIRIHRFQKALRLNQYCDLPWTSIAYESGYADQAHLIRDFQELAGASPSTLFKQPQIIASLWA